MKLVANMHAPGTVLNTWQAFTEGVCLAQLYVLIQQRFVILTARGKVLNMKQ
jgi:hypothetical protein